MISKRAIELILYSEVSDQTYYEKHLSMPTSPILESGVTLGIGYDLGYEPVAPWRKFVSLSDYRRLASCEGQRGEKTDQLVKGLSDIRISWETALQVFNEETLPKYEALTRETFGANFDKLSDDCKGVLVSLVYNRGASLVGSTRVEMANIKTHIQNLDFKKIPAEIRSMKRLWSISSGLYIRRESEAKLFESGLGIIAQVVQKVIQPVKAVVKNLYSSRFSRK